MSTEFPYEDIINQPAHISKKHPQASLSDRAARFSPFAAITGYGDMITEVARVTDERIHLDTNITDHLNYILQHIQRDIKNSPWVSITYYIPDTKKDGGSYVTMRDQVKRIDTISQQLHLVSHEQISISNIIDLELDSPHSQCTQ